MHLNFSKKDMRGCKWKSVLWGGLCCPRGRQVHAKGAFRTGTGDPTWCRERAPSGRAASPTRVRVPRAPAPGAAPPARRRSAARTWAPAAPSLYTLNRPSAAARLGTPHFCGKPGQQRLPRSELTNSSARPCKNVNTLSGASSSSPPPFPEVSSVIHSHGRHIN